MLGLITALPSRAGESTPNVDWANPQFGLPAPADTGKPVMLVPPSAPAGTPGWSGDDKASCPPALPCGTRLIGSVRKNGAVELQIPGWRW